MNVYLIIPYLKTSKPFTINKIKFSSINDVSAENADDIEELLRIRELFFISGDYQIQNFTYAVVKDVNDNEKSIQLKRMIFEIQQILGFVYSSPHPSLLSPFLNYETASIYKVLREKKVSYFKHYEDNDERVKRINAEIVNGDSMQKYLYYIEINELDFHIEHSSRIYPLDPNQALIISQDISEDLKRFIERYKSFEFVVSKPKLINIEERIYKSLHWYNKSNSALINNDESLLFLAIAFETLLELPEGQKVTDRFKETVTVLVGKINNLEIWLEQFYKNRSAIVHSGQSDNTRIIFKDEKAQTHSYQSLIYYGHVIFRVCIDAILTGLYMAFKFNLNSLLKSNNQRFSELVILLNDNKLTPTDSIAKSRDLIRDIDTFLFVKEENLNFVKMITSVKCFAKKLLEINENIPDDLMVTLERLVNTKRKDDDLETLETIKLLSEYKYHKLYTSEVFYKNNYHWFSVLVHSVWTFTFQNYFYLLQKQANK